MAHVIEAEAERSLRSRASKPRDRGIADAAFLAGSLTGVDGSQNPSRF